MALCDKKTLTIWLILLSLLGQSVVYANTSCLDSISQDMPASASVMVDMDHSKHVMPTEGLNTDLHNCCDVDSDCSMVICTVFGLLLDANLMSPVTLASAEISLVPIFFSSVTAAPFFHPPISRQL